MSVAYRTALCLVVVQNKWSIDVKNVNEVCVFGAEPQIVFWWGALD